MGLPGAVFEYQRDYLSAQCGKLCSYGDSVPVSDGTNFGACDREAKSEDGSDLLSGTAACAYSGLHIECIIPHADYILGEKMKTLKRILIILLAVAVILTAIFIAGRYGWKLGGFRACQGAGIDSVEVTGDAVHMTGFYPGSFPEGFCGYYSEEQDGKLYVGFRFSALFGFFETGDFDITIPTEGDIQEVIIKTDMVETSVWKAQTAAAEVE